MLKRSKNSRTPRNAPEKIVDSALQAIPHFHRPSTGKAMLQETKGTNQIPGEPFRRWFSDETFDLIVWYSIDDDIAGFQLCYREGLDQKALTWFKGKGFTHKRVDDGEGRPFRHKMTPILVPDGVFEKDHIVQLFEQEGKTIDPEVFRLVIQTIKKYPQQRENG